MSGKSKPGRCQICRYAFHSNGQAMQVHWSSLRNAWTCLQCHLGTGT